uniref:Uncharacterized protein n=1 Tax=viral metagenome TaxID=1070528 RepID=A0A6C0ILE5_9ZZZZ
MQPNQYQSFPTQAYNTRPVIRNTRASNARPTQVYNTRPITVPTRASNAVPTRFIRINYEPIGSVDIITKDKYYSSTHYGSIVRGKHVENISELWKECIFLPTGITVFFNNLNKNPAIADDVEYKDKWLTGNFVRMEITPTGLKSSTEVEPSQFMMKILPVSSQPTGKPMTYAFIVDTAPTTEPREDYIILRNNYDRFQRAHRTMQSQGGMHIQRQRRTKRRIIRHKNKTNRKFKKTKM